MEISKADQGEKYIFAFMGLPARGKSYLSRKLATFLDWVGFNSKVFSIGLYRRILLGVNYDWRFFEDNNQESHRLRDKCADIAIDDMIDFLFNKGGHVGIIDGTNVRRERRRQIEACVKAKIPEGQSYSFMWIESLCNIEDVVNKNIIVNKLKSPDYKGWNEEKAINDFRDRINMYEKVYTSLSPENDGENCTYIQLIDYNSEIMIRNVNGFMQSKVISFLVNLLPGDRPIYFTRHGDSQSSIKSIVGGDADLSEGGRDFAEGLCKFLQNEEFIKNKSNFKENCVIFCSTLKRSTQTAAALESIGQVLTYKCLDDLNVGICDGLSYEEIKEKYPKEFEERAKDKFNYRYPRGESYLDLINRIEPIIHELERRRGPVIVVGHQATLRCLYAYFTNTPQEQIPYINIPRKTVIRKLPQAYGFNEARFQMSETTKEFDTIFENTPNFEDNLYNIPNIKDL